MAQIIRITSEALQATVRRLLPSQVGFGEDLQASNVIQPIIDLTPTAEGSQLPTDLRRATSFGNATAFFAANTTDVIANTPGFYKIQGTMTAINPSVTTFGVLRASDGLSSKNLLLNNFSAGSEQIFPFEMTVFLDTGEFVDCNSNDVTVEVRGYSIPIADRYGEIINPAGFTFE